MTATMLASTVSLSLALASTAWAATCPIDLTNGLVGYWAFDEGSGAVAWDWAGTYPGGVVGATWSAGYRGSGLQFNGTTDYVEIGTSFPEFDGVKPFSLTAWVKPASFGPLRAIAGRHHNGPGPKQWEVLLSSVGNLSYIKVGASPIACTSTSPMTLNQWQHIAVTFDGTTRTLYRNGVPLMTCAGGSSPTAATAPVRLGASGLAGSPTDFFHGELDEVAIFDRAISADEILALMCVDYLLAPVADLNNDCRVDGGDLGILLSVIGCAGPGCCGDLDGNGHVSLSDLGLLLAAWDP